MFSLSEVLSHEHARCVQAWEKGAPKAQSVHQARTSWASMLRTLEPVENPYALYCAALALGLHLDIAAEPGIDGQVFAAPEPGG